VSCHVARQKYSNCLARERLRRNLSDPNKRSVKSSRATAVSYIDNLCMISLDKAT
jgi:hypothetical protein